MSSLSETFLETTNVNLFFFISFFFGKKKKKDSCLLKSKPQALQDGICFHPVNPACRPSGACITWTRIEQHVKGQTMRMLVEDREDGGADGRTGYLCLSSVTREVVGWGQSSSACSMVTCLYRHLVLLATFETGNEERGRYPMSYIRPTEKSL